MKKSIIILSIFVGTSLISNELSWVDEQVKAIKPARTGMSSRSLSKLKDPFIFLKKNDITVHADNTKKTIQPSATKIATTRSKETYVPSKTRYVSGTLTISAIMNNSAMINGSWYKLGDKIGRYKVKEIHRNSVLLANSEKKILLSTKSGSQKIKFLK